mgnify:CR=1 FL=1
MVINHREEVLKVYPDAIYDWDYGICGRTGLI